MGDGDMRKATTQSFRKESRIEADRLCLEEQKRKKQEKEEKKSRRKRRRTSGDIKTKQTTSISFLRHVLFSRLVQQNYNDNSII